MNNEPTPLIVIVEDEPVLAELISQYLEQSGMRTHVFHRSKPVLKFLENNFANLLLLDVNLPDNTGFELLAAIRSKNLQIPVIFATGNSIEASKVAGLNLGGDDYITKPFSYPELIARIKAVLRRAENKGDLVITENVVLTDKPFKFCNALVNPGKLQVTLPNQEPQVIGKKEIGIMSYLHSHPGEIIPRKVLIHAVWGIHANVRSRSIDQYIVKIREICRTSSAGAEALRTVHGIGYIFDPEGNKSTSTVSESNV